MSSRQDHRDIIKGVTGGKIEQYNSFVGHVRPIHASYALTFTAKTQ